MLVVSPALQGLWPLLLVPSTPFGADCSVGSCLIFSGQKGSRWGFLYLRCTTFLFQFPVESVSVSQDGPVWWQTEVTHIACHQPGQCVPLTHCRGSAKASSLRWSEVTTLTLRHRTDASQTREPFSTLTFQENHSDFSC